MPIPFSMHRSAMPCLSLIFLIFIPAPCCQAQDKIGTADSNAEYRFFENQIRPLLAKHCYQCHSHRGDKQEGGLSLDLRKGWMDGGDQGPAIVPGDLEASLLIRAVRYADPSLQMPPTRALPAEDIRKLEQWVQSGAKAPDTIPQPFEEPSDPVRGKEHWAFQPLQVSPPKAKYLNKTSSLIDAYLHESLTDRGLHRNEIASRTVRARRLSIQLTGLPPTPEQLHAFLNDSHLDSYDRLVDRLLTSPRFGERWGRHWLDLARYADSNGLDENFLFREAWRYRTWVIDALNDDMPFDQFVTMQIAGDLLPYDTVEQRDRQRIASGFLLIGPKVLLGNDERNQRMEIADEQIDTVGRALLGQTLGCARCHNHKFDPIPTVDYYALAGIFASTRVMESRYMLGQQRVMERLVGLNQNGSELDDAYEEYWRTQPKWKTEKKQAESILELLKKDQPEELAMAIESADAPIAAEARDTNKPRDERIEAQNALITSIANKLSLPPAIPPRAMIPCDADEPADEQIRIAGQFDRLGDKVPRGFLTVLTAKVDGIVPNSDTTKSTTKVDGIVPNSDAAQSTAKVDGIVLNSVSNHPKNIAESNFHSSVSYLPIPNKSSGRKELSIWLTDTKNGAGSLTARVLANRVWYHMIGRGIVRTVDNFGRTGETPSHPELLDYLASELIRSNWSIKHLVRLIALSDTFQLSSDLSEQSFASDPENRMLWRAHRRRMDPETFRDAMLLSAGKLDLTWMQSSVSYLGDQATAVGQNKVRRRTDFPCRSVYLPIIRNDLPELFDILDFANPHATTGMRPNTTVPAQGLYLLNDAAIMDASMAMARRAMENVATGDRSAAIRIAYQWIVGSPSNAEQLQTIESFVEQLSKQLAAGDQDDPELRVLAMACHAIYASSRFQYIE